MDAGKGSECSFLPMDTGQALNARFSPCSAPMDTNLLSNIQKLFSERIDVFSPVEFNKVLSPVALPSRVP